MTKIFLTLGFAALLPVLSACATATGPQYKPSSVAKGTSQIIVYGIGGTKNAVVSVNGEEHCKLPINGYFTLDVVPRKPVEISAKVRGDFVSAKYSITPRVGDRHYVSVKQNYSANIASGFLGLLSAAASQFVIESGNEAEASNTKQSCQ